MRGSWRRWWPVGWIGTSAGVVLLATQVDYGLFAAGAYVGANALTLLVEVLHRPFGSRVVTMLGWIAACQLPVFFWLLLGPTPPSVDEKHVSDRPGTA